MTRKTLTIMAMLLCTCLIIGLAGCTPKAPDPEGEPSVHDDMESIIRFGRDWPTYIDPGVGSSYTCQVAHANLYDPLVFPNTDGTVRPHVASEWTVSEDGLTYTFKIRQDIKFHSGNLLKASDVAFSMNRLLTIGEGFSHLYHGVVKECYAPDDETVVMELNYTFGPFANSLVRFYILEEDLVMANIDKSVDTYGEYGDYGKTWLLTNDAGSGPYKVKEVRLEEYVMGERFDDYFLGWEENAPKNFMVTNLNDPVAQRTAFANKELEIARDNLPQETYAEIEKMGGLVVTKSATGGWNMMLNTKKAPTDCLYFRKALAYAFDYDTLVASILPGSAKSTGPVASVLFGKNHDLPGYEYNLDKAREMLSKSKYANDPDKWFVSLAWCAEVPEQEKMSLLFQASLKELGITLEITKTPFSVMTANAQTIETTPNASIVLWSPSFLEAGDVFKSRYHSASTGSWEQMEWLLDEELDAMIDDALSTVDNDERGRKYRAIEEYIFDLCPTIWLCANDSKFAVQPYVEWPIATYYKENVPALMPGGFDLYFRDCKVFLDKK
jgi:peptide/nickel transport system substrate-binding protein